jgi:hypothetical protein
LSEEPPKEDRSLVLVAVVGLVASLIPTLVIMLLVRSCDDPVMERNYKYQREKLTKLISQPEEKVVAEPVEEIAVAGTVVVDPYMTLEQELLALAPGIYLSVRFLHESGIALTPDELQASAGVHTIEITVKAEAWDELSSDDRVELLNDTFKFIKDRYPEMTKFLRLAYDDERPSFDMKFGSEI